MFCECVCIYNVFVIFLGLQAVALVQSEGAVQQAGLALGTAVTGGLLYRSVKRFQNTPDDPAGAQLPFAVS